MTVSASVGRELTVGTIVRTAMQLAGLLESSQTPSTADAALARTLFEAMMDGLQVYNVIARARTFEEKKLVAGTFVYSLGANTLDVYGDAVYIAAGDDPAKAVSETVITQIGQDEWQTISSKSASGNPRQYYVHRASSPIAVRLWPVPTEAGTVRFQVQRKFADVDDANATMDLDVTWHEWAIWGLAYRMARAKSLPPATVSGLRVQAEEFLASAKAKAGGSTDSQFVPNHGYA